MSGIESYIRNFSAQVNLLGKIFAADPPSKDSDPECQKAIDAFGRIKTGYYAANMEEASCLIVRSINISYLANSKESPSGKVADFYRALKKEIEIHVGRAALQFEADGKIYCAAKTKEALYGEWVAVAVREKGQTEMEFTGEWKIGFVK